MGNSSENTGKGCAALINLIISVFILAILLFTLLPGLIQLPDWAQSLKKITLVPKRKVSGEIFTFTNHVQEESHNLLIINQLINIHPLPRIIKKKGKRPRPSPILTYKNIIDRQALWEIPLPEVSIEETSRIRSLFDYHNIYLIVKDKLTAIARNTGKELWQVNLNTTLPFNCTTCVQMSYDYNIAFLLTQDRVLYAISLKNGQILWQTQLNSPHFSQTGFYMLQNQIGVLDQATHEKKSPFVFRFFEINTGHHSKSITLPDFTFQQQVVFQKSHLFTLEEATNTIKIRAFNLQRQSKKPIWESELASHFLTNLSAKEITLFDETSLYIQTSFSSLQQQISKINLKTGKNTPLLQTENYQLKFVSQTSDFLLVNALNNRNSTQNELWAIHKNTGKKIWTYSLKNKERFKENFQTIEWVVQAYQNQLMLLQLLPHTSPKHKTMQFEIIDLYKGKKVKQYTFKVKNDNWSNTQFTKNYIYFSIQDLYSIDLKNFHLHVEWN